LPTAHGRPRHQEVGKRAFTSHPSGVFIPGAIATLRLIRLWSLHNLFSVHQCRLLHGNRIMYTHA
jgi:hypothetical protein